MSVSYWIEIIMSGVVSGTSYALIGAGLSLIWGTLKMICTPFTGHPVEGVLLCGTHMSTKGNV